MLCVKFELEKHVLSKESLSKLGQGFESWTFQVNFRPLKLHYVLITHIAICTCIKDSPKTKQKGLFSGLFGKSKTAKK